MRRCPVCESALESTALCSQTVDRCPKGCGTYFDAGELEAVSTLASLFHDVSLDEPEIDTVPKGERERQMPCPVDGASMQPLEMSGLIIDHCCRCDGIWLDEGELAALRLAEWNIRENTQLYIRLGS